MLHNVRIKYVALQQTNGLDNDFLDPGDIGWTICPDLGQTRSKPIANEAVPSLTRRRFMS